MIALKSDARAPHVNWCQNIAGGAEMVLTKCTIHLDLWRAWRTSRRQWLNKPMLFRFKQHTHTHQNYFYVPFDIWTITSKRLPQNNKHITLLNAIVCGWLCLTLEFYRSERQFGISNGVFIERRTAINTHSVGFLLWMCHTTFKWVEISVQIFSIRK